MQRRSFKRKKNNNEDEDEDDDDDDDDNDDDDRKKKKLIKHDEVHSKFKNWLNSLKDKGDKSSLVLFVKLS